MEKTILLILSFLLATFLNTSAQVDSGYIDVKAGKINYRIWGEGEPLVLIHNWPGSSSLGYENYAETLSRNRKVILFHLENNSKSGKGKQIYWSQMTKGLEKLRETLEIDSWDVISLSYGGRYACHYAAAFPKSINRLILVSASKVGNWAMKESQLFKAPKTENLTLPELEIIELLEKEKAKETPSADRIMRLKKALRVRYYVQNPAHYAKVANWIIHDWGGESSNHTMMSFDSAEKKLVKKLNKFKKPVLIIHGIADYLNLSNPMGNHEIFPNSKLEIMEDCGHWIFMEKPAELTALINNFLLKS